MSVKSSAPTEDFTFRDVALIISLIMIPPLVVVGVLVGVYFSPNVSEDFLFLYFGITSAISIGVWSTFVLAEAAWDKRLIFLGEFLVSISAFSALAAAVVGPPTSRVPLDVSVTFLVVGMGFLLLHSMLHAKDYMVPKSRNT